MQESTAAHSILENVPVQGAALTCESLVIASFMTHVSSERVHERSEKGCSACYIFTKFVSIYAVAAVHAEPHSATVHIVTGRK